MHKHTQKTPPPPPTTTTKKHILANRRSCHHTKTTFALSPSQALLLRQGPAGSEGPREDELRGPPVPGRAGPVAVAQPGVLGHDADAADHLLAAHVPALHRPVALPQRHQDPHQQVSELLCLSCSHSPFSLPPASVVVVVVKCEVLRAHLEMRRCKGREMVNVIRRTLELFQRQCWGNFWETGWSVYGLFRAPRYHPELNWIDLRCSTSVRICL